MAPIQKLFALTGIALALAVVAPQSMEAEETKTLTVTKDCNTAAALAPGELGYCIIIESNFRPLRDAKIRYFGPGFFAANHPFLDSWVVIESPYGDGGTAFGHCLVRGVPDVLGACQFTGGSGSLKGVMSENCVVTPDGCLRGTVVVIQHATDPLATANRSWADCSIKRLNQLVTDTLMVPLGMVVGDEFGYRATKMPLP